MKSLKIERVKPGKSVVVVLGLLSVKAVHSNLNSQGLVVTYDIEGKEKMQVEVETVRPGAPIPKDMDFIGVISFSEMPHFVYAGKVKDYVDPNAEAIKQKKIDDEIAANKQEAASAALPDGHVDKKEKGFFKNLLNKK